MGGIPLQVHEDMMKSNTRQNRVDKFLMAATAGTVAVLIYPLLHLTIDVAFNSAATGTVWFVAAFAMLGAFGWSLVGMLVWRRTDEFTLAMWHAGTSGAFLMTIAWLFFGDLFQSGSEAWIVANDPERKDPGLDVIGNWALPVTLAGFFIGFHYKRLRGDL